MSNYCLIHTEGRSANASQGLSLSCTANSQILILQTTSSTFCLWTATFSCTLCLACTRGSTTNPAYISYQSICCISNKSAPFFFFLSVIRFKNLLYVQKKESEDSKLQCIFTIFAIWCSMLAFWNIFCLFFQMCSAGHADCQTTNRIIAKSRRWDILIEFHLKK